MSRDIWADGQYARARNAIRACTDTRHPAFKLYGARGVTVWTESAAEFAAHLRTLPGWDDRTLDMRRIDPTRGYEPGNIHFVRQDRMDGLTESEYTAYMLREAEGLSQYAIAERMGLSRPTVAHHLRQATAKIMGACDVTRDDAGDRNEDRTGNGERPRA